MAKLAQTWLCLPGGKECDLGFLDIEEATRAFRQFLELAKRDDSYGTTEGNDAANAVEIIFTVKPYHLIITAWQNQNGLEIDACIPGSYGLFGMSWVSAKCFQFSIPSREAGEASVRAFITFEDRDLAAFFSAMKEESASNERLPSRRLSAAKQNGPSGRDGYGFWYICGGWAIVAFILWFTLSSISRGGFSTRDGNWISMSANPIHFWLLRGFWFLIATAVMWSITRKR